MRRIVPWLVLLAGASLSAGRGDAAPADVGALRGELQARSSQRDSARAESQALRQDLARLQAQLAELRAIEASGMKGLGDKRARLDALNAREAALAGEMGRNQTALARLLGALELYRREPPPALLVSPGSAKDAVRAAILVRAVQPELRQRAAVFKARSEQLIRIRRAVTSVSEDLITSESSLADNRGAIERAIQEKTALQRQLDADAVDADQRTQALAARLRALGVAPGLSAPQTPGAPIAAPASLRAPVEGAPVRRFGQPSPSGQKSDGWTWRTPPGAEVRAPGGGVVEYSGALKGWGGVLIVNVGGGYHLVLAGLDRIGTPVGRTVRAGEAVGAMAASATPELYLEMRRDGAPQDPARWLRIPLATQARR